MVLRRTIWGSQALSISGKRTLIQLKKCACRQRPSNSHMGLPTDQERTWNFYFLCKVQYVIVEPLVYQSHLLYSNNHQGVLKYALTAIFYLYTCGNMDQFSLFLGYFNQRVNTIEIVIIPNFTHWMCIACEIMMFKVNANFILNITQETTYLCKGDVTMYAQICCQHFFFIWNIACSKTSKENLITQKCILVITTWMELQFLWHE